MVAARLICAHYNMYTYVIYTSAKLSKEQVTRARNVVDIKSILAYTRACI